MRLVGGIQREALGDALAHPGVPGVGVPHVCGWRPRVLDLGRRGQPLTHTDPVGNTTRHTATYFGVPATRTDPDATTYAFSYDTELRLTGVTTPQGLIWSYAYDEAARLVTEADFNGRTLAYTQDVSDGLTSRTNGAGETLRFARDALGRVIGQRTDKGDTLRTPMAHQAICPTWPMQTRKSPSSGTCWAVRSRKPSTDAQPPTRTTPWAESSGAPPRPG
ncbi:hypothetical protein ACFWWA_27915 [Streptomyces goshikiensis]|uniref:hypothetical protein n=1 Tax=Streptomyces goshikiensis TaxID=1942 RepID=UPI00365D9B6B